jgi:hypothetical protein
MEFLILIYIIGALLLWGQDIGNDDRTTGQNFGGYPFEPPK